MLFEIGITIYNPYTRLWPRNLINLSNFYARYRKQRESQLIYNLKFKRLAPLRTSLEYIGYCIWISWPKQCEVSTRWMIIGRSRSSSKLHASVLRLAHVYGGGIRWVGHRLRRHMLIIYGTSILGCMAVWRILASLLLLVILLLRLVTVWMWEIEGGRGHWSGRSVESEGCRCDGTCKIRMG